MESVQDSLSTLAVIFHQKMNAFQEDLNKTSSPVSTTSLASEFTTFKTFIVSSLSTLQSQVEVLSRDMDRLEMRRRRKMILLHGIPEDKSEDTTAKITTLAANQLQLPNFSTTSIKTSYRLGRPTDGPKPRPIVVKFCDVSMRDKVWFAKTKLKGSGITQSEFLTKTRHSTFLEARQRFGITNCWSRDGYIYVIAPDGVRHKIECMSELNKLTSVIKSPNQEKAVSVPTRNLDLKTTTAKTKRVTKK